MDWRICVPSLADLKIELWADGADYAQMVGLSQHRLIKGFTTNPSLLRQAGVTDYDKFIKEILRAIPDKPISFEVLADDLKEMERQARKLADFGPNVWVKIPVTTTTGVSTCGLIRVLSRAGIAMNVTAVMTKAQIDAIESTIIGDPHLIVSVFAGRISDTGIDPSDIVCYAMSQFVVSNVRILWASTREVRNVLEAQACDCDIITLTMAQIQKLDLIGKDLTEYSRETVQQFYDDGQKAGLLL